MPESLNQFVSDQMTSSHQSVGIISPPTSIQSDSSSCSLDIGGSGENTDTNTTTGGSGYASSSCFSVRRGSSTRSSGGHRTASTAALASTVDDDDGEGGDDDDAATVTSAVAATAGGGGGERRSSTPVSFLDESKGEKWRNSPTSGNSTTNNNSSIPASVCSTAADGNATTVAWLCSLKQQQQQSAEMPANNQRMPIKDCNKKLSIKFNPKEAKLKNSSFSVAKNGAVIKNDAQRERHHSNGRRQANFAILNSTRAVVNANGTADFPPPAYSTVVSIQDNSSSESPPSSFTSEAYTWRRGLITPNGEKSAASRSVQSPGLLLPKSLANKSMEVRKSRPNDCQRRCGISCDMGEQLGSLFHSIGLFVAQHRISLIVVSCKQ